MLKNPIINYFNYEHLPEHLRAISQPFHALAHHMHDTLPDNPEKSTALRKLLEAKDCAVRAVLPLPEPEEPELPQTAPALD